MRFKKFLFLKAQRTWLWLVLITGGVFLPRYFAHAFPGLDILTAPFIFLAKLITLLLVALPVSLGFLYISQILLNWASSPALIGGITSNQFVMAGWGVVRDFSNMFFILILVAIGIATALRVKQYEVKKTLPALVIAAILINFSPVICGLVIDASNIFMNFFLTAGSSGFNKSLSIAQTSGASLMRDIRHAMGSWSEIWKGILFFKMLAAIVFNIVAGTVLLLMALLFIMRNLVLWILVILSPLAFLSAVLPATKKIVFDKWKKEFLNWCFIGVTASFFIYLAQLMMNLGVDHLFGAGKIATDTSEFGGNVITTILMESIPVIFLLIGYFVTLSTSSMGANLITSGFKRMNKWGWSKTKGYGKNKLANLRDKAVEKIPEGVKKKMVEMAKAPAYSGAQKALGGAYLTWLKRKTGKIGLKVTRAKEKEADEAEKEADKMSTDEIVAAIRGTTSAIKKTAYLNSLAKRGKIDDVLYDENNNPNGLKFAEDITPIMKFAQEHHREKDIFSAIPQAAQYFLTPEKGQTHLQAFEEMIRKIKPNKVKNMTKEALGDNYTLDAIIKNWNKAQFSSLFTEMGQESSDKISERIKDLAKAETMDPMDWLEENNKRFYDYLKSSAGQGFIDFK